MNNPSTVDVLRDAVLQLRKASPLSKMLIGYSRWERLQRSLIISIDGFPAGENKFCGLLVIVDKDNPETLEFE